MDKIQKSSYLQFTNIWNRQKDFDAHTRRLGAIQNQRCSPYNYQRHQDLFEENKTHFHSVNKRNDEFKKYAIDKDNNLIIKRLVRVTKKVQSFNQIPSKRTQNLKKDLQQLLLIEENKRMKDRISSTEAQLNFVGLNEDFKKHQYIQKRMEKFYADDSQRVKLKAQENVYNYQNHITKKPSRAYSFSTHELPGHNPDSSFVTSSAGQQDNLNNNDKFLDSCGPAFVNNQLKTTRQQNLSQIKHQDQQKLLDKNLRKFRSFFRANTMIKFDQQFNSSLIMKKESEV